MILFTCQQWQAAHARAGDYILCSVEDELHSRTYKVALLKAYFTYKSYQNYAE